MGSESVGTGRRPGLVALESPLPPLPAAPRAGTGWPGIGPVAEAPRWSPLATALALFGALWACFIPVAPRLTLLPSDDLAGLAHVLATASGIVALVLVTLSVAHTQVSGLRPRPAIVGVAGLGAAQGLAAAAISSGDGNLWSVAAWLFVLIGVAVPLIWVGGQFQNGVRRQRVERSDSLTLSWIARARHQAYQTVESVHRHDIRSMLFVIDGAARALADASLSAEQRAAFGEMLCEAVKRMGQLVDIRREEIRPFTVEGITTAILQAERRAGRQVAADVPDSLLAVGREADVAAVLRILVETVDRKSSAGVQLRGARDDGAVVLWIEPAGAPELPLFRGKWNALGAGAFTPGAGGDDETVDLYGAARLLAEQGGDLWSTAGQTRFAVRLPTAAASRNQDVA
jgi:hypothetical protein